MPLCTGNYEWESLCRGTESGDIDFQDGHGASEDRGDSGQVDVRPTIEVSHDSKWTAEALGNILDNAVKYTQSGGKITVSARNLEMYVVISISDNGIGIDPGHYNRIFQRFYREAKAAKTEGLGIGLYLARQIITLQGGDIKGRSKEGYGTEFEVFLPRRAA